jgi:hypothetical protein
MVLTSCYDLVAFGRVYQFGWWGSIWRFSAAMALASVLTAVVLAVVGLSMALLSS